MEECRNDLIRELLRKLFRALEDDLVVMIIKCLLHNGPLSFRSLGRKLHVNYKRLNRTLKVLIDAGIVEVYIVNVSPNKRYRFYLLNENYAKILKDIT